MHTMYAHEQYHRETRKVKHELSRDTFMFGFTRVAAAQCDGVCE